MEFAIEDWVNQASQDRVTFRQAVHIVLQSIASNEYLRPKMVMKGGVLLSIRYQSTRFTEDIDFSSSMRLDDIDKDTFVTELNEALAITSGELPYQVTCKIQSITIQPKNAKEATFPAFKLTIGYARNTDRNQISRLNKKQSANTVKIDYSLNEHSYSVDHITLTDENHIDVYSLTDLVAEKIRSVMQQIVRNRSRRQDIYDLNYLLENAQPTEIDKLSILTTLLNKSNGRLELGFINPNTLDREDIRQRSFNEYGLLKDEVEGDLPDFDTIYQRILDFYKSLPWDSVTGWQNDAG